jgi:hypothetical protein
MKRRESKTPKNIFLTSNGILNGNNEKLKPPTVKTEKLYDNVSKEIIRRNYKYHHVT